MRGIWAKQIFLVSVLSSFLILTVSVPVQAQFVQEWVAFFDGDRRADDAILDIGTGPSGNVYVTGVINHAISGGRSTMATAAYDEFGTMLWLREGERYMWGQDIAVDQYDNVYVAGGRGITKYDRYGNALWTSTYGGLWLTRGVKVDIHGNVYARGSNGDYVLLKFDNDGYLLWVAEYDGLSHGSDYARDFTIDNLGNVYVTGESQVGSGNKHIVTLKYDTWGNRVWESHYDDPDVSDVDAVKMVLDGPRLYIIAYIGLNYTTIAYDTDGDFEWARGYDGPDRGADYPYDIIVDAAGNVYVTGVSYGKDSGYDYVTLCYDEWGNKRWEERFNGHGNGDDEARVMACDRSTGTVFVTGTCEDFDGSTDIVTVAYNTRGENIGSIVFDGPGAHDDAVNAILSDRDGNIYVAGLSQTSSSYFFDFVTVKYSFLSGPSLRKPFPEKIKWHEK